LEFYKIEGYFLIILTLAIVCALVYYFLKNYKKNPKLLNVALTMIITGAIGNFYDRLFQGYVVVFY